jgi:hypothetical protein
MFVFRMVILYMLTHDRISLNVAYPLELLPFNIRANGLLMQNIATYICLFLNQYLIPIGIDKGSWK